MKLILQSNGGVDLENFIKIEVSWVKKMFRGNYFAYADVIREGNLLGYPKFGLNKIPVKIDKIFTKEDSINKLEVPAIIVAYTRANLNIIREIVGTLENAAIICGEIDSFNEGAEMMEKLQEVLHSYS